MNLVKKSSVYLFLNLSVSMIPILIMPVLTNVLSPSEYGKLAIFQTLIIAFSCVVGLNTIGAANRKHFDHNITDKDISIYNVSCFYLAILSFILLFAIIVFSKDILTTLFNIELKWIYFSLLTSLFLFFINFNLGQFIVKSKISCFSVVQISYLIFNVSLTFIFIFFFFLGVEGRIFGIVMSSGIVFFCLLFVNMRKCDKEILRFSKTHVNDALKFGFPLIFNGLGTFFINNADKLIINKYIGSNSLGLYMVAMQISAMYMITFDAINKGITPWLYIKLKEDNRQGLLSKLVVLIICSILLSFIVSALLPYIFNYFLSSNYVGSMDYVRLLLIGQCFNGGTILVTSYYLFYKKTKTLSAINISVGCLSLLLLSLMIIKFGVYGAVYAFVLSKFIQMMVLVIYAYFKGVDI